MFNDEVSNAMQKNITKATISTSLYLSYASRILFDTLLHPTDICICDGFHTFLNMYKLKAFEAIDIEFNSYAHI
jgi:hypothetical protein